MSISNNFSFNNKNYTVGNLSSSVSQNFATALEKAASDGNIDATEKQELESLSSKSNNQNEKDIVLQISKGASAKYDKDGEGSITPVEITFGNIKPKPAPSVPQTKPVESKVQSSPVENTTISFPESSVQVEHTISKEMLAYFKNAISNKKSISYESFEELKKIAEISKNPQDLEFINSLADAAIAKIDAKNSDKSIKLRMPDGSDLSIKINIQPPPTKDAQGNRISFRVFLTNFKKSIEASIQGSSTQAYTITPPKVGLRTNVSTGLTKTNKFSTKVGFEYTGNLGKNLKFGVGADYSFSLFQAPGGFIGQRFFGVGRGKTPVNTGLGFTASIYVGDKAQFSYSTKDGFSIMGNIPVSKDKYFTVGYNQTTGVRVGFSLKIK